MSGQFHTELESFSDSETLSHMRLERPKPIPLVVPRKLLADSIEFYLYNISDFIQHLAV